MSADGRRGRPNGLPKTGGRKKGSLNKATLYKSRNPDEDFDPFAIMRAIAKGELPCGVCQGSGKTKWLRKPGGKLAERVCGSCYGSGRERITPELRARMAAELAMYQAPKRRAIEILPDSRNEGDFTYEELLSVRYRRTQEARSDA